MSKIRNAIVAAAAIATAATSSLVAAPQANAMTTSEAKYCSSGPNIYCSMYYARGTNYTAKYGATNSAVRNLQKALIEVRLGPTSGATGYFGSQTKAQLIKYQYSRKLRQTGVLDYATLTALRAGAGQKVAVATTTTRVTTSSTSTTRGARVVNFAYAQLGKPYVYGATGPSSYDCSGLTQAAWKSVGVSIPRVSNSQLSSLPSVSKSNLRPGDIVGYYSGSHVGIYVGNGYIIHASRPGQPIKKVALNTMPYMKAVRPAS